MYFSFYYYKMSAQEIALAMQYAQKRATNANVVVDMQSVMRNLENMYESAGYVKDNAFMNEAVLHHAGISLRVSDKADGEQYGMQTVVGSTFKKDDDEGVIPYHLPYITHKLDYKESKCSMKPLRETHMFFNINTHIVYKHGKEEIFYNDTPEVKSTVEQFNNLLEQLMETKEGISTWLYPVVSKQWGTTVDNSLKKRLPLTLTSYRNAGDPVDSSRIKKRYQAIQILNGDNYAFRICKTVERNNQDQQKMYDDVDEWFNSNIYSFQYVTKTGVRQNFKEATVYSVMANTQVIIKHYGRLHVDLDSIRQTLNMVLGPFYAQNNKRRKNKRPWLSNEKSVYIRYVMRDNSLLNSFLEVYIAKSKEIGNDADMDDDDDDQPFVDIQLEKDDEEDDDDNSSNGAYVHIELEDDDEADDDIQPYVQIELEDETPVKKRVRKSATAVLATEPRRSERLKKKPPRSYKK
jgi:hypothetical protein